MENLRSFTVTHVPWSNTKPNRVKIRDNRHRKTVIIPYPDSSVLDRVETVAEDYLVSIGIHVFYMAEADKGFTLLTRDFKTPLK